MVCIVTAGAYLWKILSGLIHFDFLSTEGVLII